MPCHSAVIGRKNQALPFRPVINSTILRSCLRGDGSRDPGPYDGSRDSHIQRLGCLCDVVMTTFRLGQEQPLNYIRQQHDPLIVAMVAEILASESLTAHINFVSVLRSKPW